MNLSIKRLILVLVIFTSLLGTELPVSKDFINKETGVSLFAGSYHWLSNNTLNLATTERDEADNLDVSQAENPDKFYFEVSEIKIKHLYPVVHIKAEKQPFFFDLPPPCPTC